MAQPASYFLVFVTFAQLSLYNSQVYYSLMIDNLCRLVQHIFTMSHLIHPYPIVIETHVK